MNTILLILHLLGFGAGIAASLGNNLALILAGKSPPEEAAGLRRFMSVMIRFADGGLVVLWITGAILLWTKYGGSAGIGELPWSFHAKIISVILITLLLGVMHMTLARIKRGDMSVAARMPILGRVGFVLMILIVIFAAMTFH